MTTRPRELTVAESYDWAVAGLRLHKSLIAAAAYVILAVNIRRHEMID